MWVPADIFFPSLLVVVPNKGKWIYPLTFFPSSNLSSKPNTVKMKGKKKEYNVDGIIREKNIFMLEICQF
jgi:hypothetical protein